MKDSKKRKINIPFIISAIIFFSALVAFIWMMFKMKDEKEDFEKIKEAKNEPVIIDTATETDAEEPSLAYYLIDGTVVQAEFKDLYLQNSDIVGWIQIDDTPVDYPVMFTPEDEQYYIHKDIDKNYSASGTLFIGANASITKPSTNMVIYGHHMANNTMFKPLDKYADEDYYKEHKYIQFDTLRQTGTYEVVAAFRTKIYYTREDGFMYYDYAYLNDIDTYNEYMGYIDSLKLYDTDMEVEFGDQLITLSTCAYHTYNGRFVVVAKRIDGLEVNLDNEPIEIINTD